MDMESLPKFEDFKLTEEVLQKADQSQLVKNITRSFDINDLKIYLKGFMLGFGVSDRKKLTTWLDDGGYKRVIDFIIKASENESDISKLKVLLKALKKEAKD